MTKGDERRPARGRRRKGEQNRTSRARSSSGTIQSRASDAALTRGGSTRREENASELDLGAASERAELAGGEAAAVVPLSSVLVSLQVHPTRSVAPETATPSCASTDERPTSHLPSSPRTLPRRSQTLLPSPDLPSPRYHPCARPAHRLPTLSTNSRRPHPPTTSRAPCRQTCDPARQPRTPSRRRPSPRRLAPTCASALLADDEAYQKGRRDGQVRCRTSLASPLRAPSASTVQLAHLRLVHLQRYGATLRKTIKKMEITQHATYTCVPLSLAALSPRRPDPGPVLTLVLFSQQLHLLRQGQSRPPALLLRWRGRRSGRVRGAGAAGRCGRDGESEGRGAQARRH